MTILRGPLKITLRSPRLHHILIPPALEQERKRESGGERRAGSPGEQALLPAAPGQELQRATPFTVMAQAPHMPTRQAKR